MTVRKHFQQLVRERIKETGESYPSARRQILKDTPQTTANPGLGFHFPGSIAATTSLRILLGSTGITDPSTGKPFTEAMLFGIAGGVGIGVAAFHYVREDLSSFFISGRHLWFDDVAYLTAACNRFGIKPMLKECRGAKAAEKNLRDVLETGPCIAWVDMAHLPHRALPATFSGGGYHIVTVYKIEDDHAWIGDLTDEPIRIARTDLATARARIVKQKNRLLAIPSGTACPSILPLVQEGLSACHRALTARPGKGPLAMSTLASLKKWADRLHGSKDKESWEKLFPPGSNLWRGLTSLHLFIEIYGSGGGLGRPMMADFLSEAGESLKDNRLKNLGEHYAELGRGWSELAKAALPDSVATLREARELHNRYAELFFSGGTVEEKQQVWSRLGELAKEAAARFPLDEKACADLRADLQTRVRKLIAAEEASLGAMAAIA